MIRRVASLVGIACSLWPALLLAEALSDTTVAARSTLLIRSQPEGAEIWLDGRAIGRTPIRDTSVSVGRHVVALYHPSRLNWNAVTVTETLSVSNAETVERLVRLPGRVLIISDPSEAEVYKGGERVGRTPMEQSVERPAPLSLILREEGFEPVSLSVDSAGFHTVMVRLAAAPSLRSAEMDREEDKLASKRWLVGGSATTAVLSGVIAAALKDRSNRVYDGYLLTRDPGQRDRSRRLDTAAGVAFAVMQVSIGILMYSLISD